MLAGKEARVVRQLAPDEPLPHLLPLAELRAGGFAVESAEDERALVAEAYATYLEELDKTETQLVVVPTFGCNLRCVYCYQEPFVSTAGGLISPETIPALFAYIDRFHGDETPRPYLTLFGGEPLVDAAASHDRIERIVGAAEERALRVAVVTNGYAILEYLPVLSRPAIREVQVTLDGPPAMHDQRRPLASGAGTFDRIARGIDTLVAAGIPVNLRVVVDRENLAALPELAALAEQRGWLGLPESAFKTQIGRNYDFFGCASRQGREQASSMPRAAKSRHRKFTLAKNGGTAARALSIMAGCDRCRWPCRRPHPASGAEHVLAPAGAEVHEDLARRRGGEIQGLAAGQRAAAFGQTGVEQARHAHCQPGMQCGTEKYEEGRKGRREEGMRQKLTQRSRDLFEPAPERT